MAEKMKMHSQDLVMSNIEKIAELFPNCVTESADTDGRIARKIDFDLLRQELADEIVEGPLERYHLNWPGKREAMLAANSPIAKTLRPCREESVDFDATKNLFIEGDNLEALKLLQETYLGKVKMIYIDPPYNTGHDFVYNDSFLESTDAYLIESQQKTSEGNRLMLNPETNGRFHSTWMSMIYSRIRLARNMLSDDGVLFISIDDNEVANLRKICDEVFGHDNLIAQICHKARASVSNDKIISSNHNHILLFARKKEVIEAKRHEFGLPPDLTGFSMQDERGKYKHAPVDGPGGGSKGNPFYEFLGVEQYFRFSKSRMQAMFDEGLIVKTGEGLQQKIYLDDAASKRKTDTTWWDDKYYTSSATTHLKDMMGGKLFDNPKPVALVERMLQLCARADGDIIMDFFAGSGTTAAAVLTSNLNDGVSRRYILVQLQEIIDEGPAYEAGYKFISDLTKQRIRNTTRSIVDSNTLTGANVDLGFRVLKVNSSNMKDVYYSPADTSQAMLSGLVDNIKPDRTGEDLLFQVLLDCGVDLGLPIKSEKIDGCEVFFVNDSEHAPPDLVTCFDHDVSESLVKTIAAKSPLRAVFRDQCFASDADKINVEQIFKQLSPQTQLRSL
jgi:adenine-specific DNA-methyltransferase